MTSGGGIRGIKDDSARERAILELFPAEEKHKLAMMGRTPPHMIMHMVDIDIMTAAQQFFTQRIRALQEWEKKGNKGSDELVDEDEANFTNEDYLKVLEGDGDFINLLEVFKTSYHTHMIGRSGAGRDDMLKIFEREMSRKDGDDPTNRVIMG